MLAVTAIAVVAVASVEPAFAKKDKVIVTINGKRRKFKGRYVLSSYSGNGTIIVATKPARLLRTVGFGCAIYPPSETFPYTPPAEVCNANYTETRNGIPIGSWLAVTGVSVTYDSFDGVRLTGSFSGTLDAISPNGAPSATMEGTFDVKPTAQE